MSSKDKVTGRPTTAPNPLESPRQTTIVDPTLPKGTAGTAGPSIQGLVKVRDYLRQLDYSTLFLADQLTEAQVRGDAANWFPEGVRYIRSSGDMMNQKKDAFQGLNYEG